jgi:hypothetical protein
MTDSLHNPDLAALLRKLRTLQADTPERQAYLDELARRIKAGEYTPDPNRIAAKLIDESIRRTPQQPQDGGDRSAETEEG